MKKGRTLTVESILIKQGKQGDRFWTQKPDRHITATASFYKKKVSTQRVVKIYTKFQSPQAEQLTEVTIL